MISPRIAPLLQGSGIPAEHCVGANGDRGPVGLCKAQIEPAVCVCSFRDRWPSARGPEQPQSAPSSNPLRTNETVGGKCRRLKSMLAPNKRRVPEAVPAPGLRPGGGPQSDWVSGDNSLSGTKALVRGVSTQFSEGRNARKSAGLVKADQRACRRR
jgi:hypothetical protein